MEQAQKVHTFRSISVPVFFKYFRTFENILTSRVIMSSHPVCNTIMLVGVIACFVSVFLLGIDGRFIAPWEYPAICQARAWMLSTGFTLAFGAMFSKVWRVHRLTTKTKADQAKVSIGESKSTRSIVRNSFRDFVHSVITYDRLAD